MPEDPLLEDFERRRAAAERRLLGILEEAAVEIGLGFQEQLDAIAEPEARLDFLRRLSESDPQALLYMSWVLDCLLEQERLAHAHLVELLGRPDWRREYEAVASDERLADASAGELASWARIRFAGGPEQFERVIRRRVTGQHA